MTREILRRQVGRLCLLMLCAIVVATAAAHFARLAWLPELASHFRVQYLLGALGLVPAFLALHRRALALAALLVALPNAWYAGPYVMAAMVPASVANDSSPDVRLVSLNLYYRNEEYATVRDYLARSDPDILVLSELTPAWVGELREVRERYPYWMSLDRRSPWGLGVFSRFPLRGVRATDLGLGGSVNVIATVALPSGDIQLVAAHLASPTTPSRAARRNAQLEDLTALLDDVPAGADGRKRRLLVGDLNITPYSPYLRDLLARTGMNDARRSAGLLATWPAWFLPLQIHIDHCIADAATGVTRVARGPAVGSDHYPIEIALR